MKIIHQNGYTKDELMLYRLTILSNLLTAARTLVTGLRKFTLEPELPENRVSITFEENERELLDNGSSWKLITSAPLPLNRTMQN